MTAGFPNNTTMVLSDILAQFRTQYEAVMENIVLMNNNGMSRYS